MFEGVVELPLGSYVVSVSARAGFKRLHRMGDCPNKAGVHFLHFEALGDVFPDAKLFDARCSICFGRSHSAQVPDVDSAPSSGSSSDS